MSVNEVICHGIPDSRPLEDGDIVNLDVTVYFNGFHAGTFLFGRGLSSLASRYAMFVAFIFRFERNFSCWGG